MHKIPSILFDIRPPVPSKSFSRYADMILPWLNAFGSGRRDLALMTTGREDYLESVRCREESNGVMTGGFSCLFEPMPHLCIFHDQRVRT